MPQLGKQEKTCYNRAGKGEARMVDRRELPPGQAWKQTAALEELLTRPRTP